MNEKNQCFKGWETLVSNLRIQITHYIVYIRKQKVKTMNLGIRVITRLESDYEITLW